MNLTDRLAEFKLEQAKYQSEIFKGVDATILGAAVWNEAEQSYDHFYAWYGGLTAGISQEMVHELWPDAVAGDVVALGELALILVEYSDIGNFWYARMDNFG
jgi:hypothetical protein